MSFADRNRTSATKRPEVDPRRAGSSFVSIPWEVLHCNGYQKLSHVARSLLLEFALQINVRRDSANNGRLLCTQKYMRTRGWRSSDTLNRALNELLEGGFIYRTMQGHRPNKASWYAVTFRKLEPSQRYDPGTEADYLESGWRAYAKSGFPVVGPLITKQIDKGIAWETDSTGNLKSVIYGYSEQKKT